MTVADGSLEWKEFELFRGKSVTKSFRFPSQAISELESEAKRKSISLNSLMNKLIRTYLEWGRFIERHGGLSLNEPSFSTLINEIDDMSIFEKAGAVAGSKTPRRLLLMLGLPIRKDTVLRVVDIICEHAISYRYTHKIIGKKHKFLITHGLGRKWSIWFGSYLRTMFKDLLELELKIRLLDEDSIWFEV